MPKTRKQMRPRRRRRQNKLRMPRPLSSNNIMSFKRVVELPSITTNNVTTGLGAISFKLSDLPNYTEFTGLFDEYCIKMIKVVIIPPTNAYTTSTASLPTTIYNNPNFYTVIDNDDALTPGSLNDLFQYDTFRMHRGMNTIKRYFKPAIADTVYGGISGAYSVKKNQWLDAAYPGVEHYALKWAVDPMYVGATIDLTYRVYATYYFQCKGVR